MLKGPALVCGLAAVNLCTKSITILSGYSVSCILLQTISRGTGKEVVSVKKQEKEMYRKQFPVCRTELWKLLMAAEQLWLPQKTLNKHNNRQARMCLKLHQKSKILLAKYEDSCQHHSNSVMGLSMVS